MPWRLLRDSTSPQPAAAAAPTPLGVGRITQTGRNGIEPVDAVEEPFESRRRERETDKDMKIEKRIESQCASRHTKEPENACVCTTNNGSDPPSLSLSRSLFW